MSSVQLSCCMPHPIRRQPPKWTHNACRPQRIHESGMRSSGSPAGKLWQMSDIRANSWARTVVAPYAAAMPFKDAGQAVRSVRTYVRWVRRAKPGDYVIALCAASTATPVIGRHLQPISGMAALGVGGKTYLPSIVFAMARARFGPGGSQRQLLAQTP